MKQERLCMSVCVCVCVCVCVSLIPHNANKTKNQTHNIQNGSNERLGIAKYTTKLKVGMPFFTLPYLQPENLIFIVKKTKKKSSCPKTAASIRTQTMETLHRAQIASPRDNMETDEFHFQVSFLVQLSHRTSHNRPQSTFPRRQNPVRK